MKQLPKLNLIDFDYELPNERIAYTPCQNRADSKLLVWDKQIIADSQYQNITDFIPAHSTLLFNNSKVIAARILYFGTSAAGDDVRLVMKVSTVNLSRIGFNGEAL